MKKIPAALSACCMAIVLLSGAAHGQDSPSTPALTFRIEPRSMKSALTQFGEQTGLQILFSKEAVEALASRGVSGKYTAEQALRELLAESGLSYEFVNPRTVRIWATAGNSAATGASEPQTAIPAPGRESLRLAQLEGESTGAGKDSSAPPLRELNVALPEILVKSSKILNMDVKRSRDDAEPNVLLYQV